MQRITLPGTALSVSRVCLGTMTFGGQTDEVVAAAMLDAALDQGVNFVDTANVYAGGKSETILGKLLAGRRNRVVLATKVGIKAGDGPDDAGLSAAAIVKGIEGSLRRLQTDHIDLYYLHQPDYAVRPEASLAAMDRLIRAGKVRYVGVSNFAGWQVCRLLWMAEKNGFSPVRVVQPMYNLLTRGIEQEFLPMCREFGLGTIVYNPLAGGLLTGKHCSEAPLPGTRFETMPVYKDRYWHDANFAVLRRLSDAAQAAGRSLISTALNWLLHHSQTDCVVFGASRHEQLTQNLATIGDGPLSPELVTACDDVWAALRGPSPRYNR